MCPLPLYPFLCTRELFLALLRNPSATLSPQVAAACSCWVIGDPDTQYAGASSSHSDTVHERALSQLALLHQDPSCNSSLCDISRHQ